jgi:hypothetical protein
MPIAPTIGKILRHDDDEQGQPDHASGHGRAQVPTRGQLRVGRRAESVGDVDRNRIRGRGGDGSRSSALKPVLPTHKRDTQSGGLVAAAPTGKAPTAEVGQQPEGRLVLGRRRGRPPSKDTIRLYSASRMTQTCRRATLLTRMRLKILQCRARSSAEPKPMLVLRITYVVPMLGPSAIRMYSARVSRPAPQIGWAFSNR